MKSLVPVISRNGRVVTPGLRMSRMNAVIPAGPGTGSVRASRYPKSACWAQVLHTFCPLTTYWSPFRSARVFSAVRSLPASGSLNSWVQMWSPRASRGRYVCFCSSVPYCASGAAHERVAEHGRDTASGELLGQHPAGEPVGDADAGAVLVGDVPRVVERAHPDTQLRDVVGFLGDAQPDAWLPAQSGPVLRHERAQPRPVLVVLGRGFGNVDVHQAGSAVASAIAHRRSRWRHDSP